MNDEKRGFCWAGSGPGNLDGQGIKGGGERFVVRCTCSDWKEWGWKGVLDCCFLVSSVYSETVADLQYPTIVDPANDKGHQERAFRGWTSSHASMRFFIIYSLQKWCEWWRSSKDPKKSDDPSGPIGPSGPREIQNPSGWIFPESRSGWPWPIRMTPNLPLENDQPFVTWFSSRMIPEPSIAGCWFYSPHHCLLSFHSSLIKILSSSHMDC